MGKVDFCILQKLLGSTSSVNSTAAINYPSAFWGMSQNPEEQSLGCWGMEDSWGCRVE